MSRFDVTTQPQGLYPDGLQTDTLIQNLGPDSVFVDAVPGVSSTTGLLLSVGQSVVWKEGRPLYLVSNGTSSVLATQNGGTPNVVTQKFNAIGAGQSYAPTAAFPSGHISFGQYTSNDGNPYFPIISSSSFRTIIIQVKNAAGAGLGNDLLQCNVQWYDDFTGLYPTNAPVSTSTGMAVFPNTDSYATYRFTTQAPRFRFYFRRATNQSTWLYNMDVKLYGVYDELKPGVNFETLVSATPSLASSYEDEQSSSYVQAANTALIIYAAPKFHTRALVGLHAFPTAPTASGYVTFNQQSHVAGGFSTFSNANAHHGAPTGNPGGADAARPYLQVTTSYFNDSAEMNFSPYMPILIGSGTAAGGAPAVNVQSVINVNWLD